MENLRDPTIYATNKQQIIQHFFAAFNSFSLVSLINYEHINGTNVWLLSINSLFPCIPKLFLGVQVHLSLPCGVDFAQTGVEPGANQDGTERKKLISIFRKIRYIIHIKTCITYYSKNIFLHEFQEIPGQDLKISTHCISFVIYQFYKNFTIRVNTHGVSWKMRLFYIYFFVLFTILWKIRILRNKEKIKNHSYNLSMCLLYVQYLHFYIYLYASIWIKFLILYLSFSKTMFDYFSLLLQDGRYIYLMSLH